MSVALEVWSGRDEFARVTPVSYALADLALSGIWIAAVAIWAPSWSVVLPGIAAATGSVLIDYVWCYRNGRRLLWLDDVPPPPAFVGWWLVFWFLSVIPFNIGTYVGIVLHVGVHSEQALVWTLVFWLWFWILTPLFSRVLRDAGVGVQVVRTVRKVGSHYTRGRILILLALCALLYFGSFPQQPVRILELLVLGMAASAAMEIPLYLLDIRPGAQAWKTLLSNIPFEWTVAVPVFYWLLVATGQIGP